MTIATDTRTAIESFFAFIGKGEIDEALAYVDEPIDWFTPGSTDLIPWMGPRRTRAEVKEFFAAAASHLTAEAFEVRSILVDGDDAVVLGRFQYQVNATGHSFASDFALELHVTAGRIDRYHMHEDSYAISLAFLT